MLTKDKASTEARRIAALPTWSDKLAAANAFLAAHPEMDVYEFYGLCNKYIRNTPA